VSFLVSSLVTFSLSMLPSALISTLFPYTTLFRSFIFKVKINRSISYISLFSYFRYLGSMKSIFVNYFDCSFNNLSILWTFFTHYTSLHFNKRLPLCSFVLNDASFIIYCSTFIKSCQRINQKE